MGSPVRVTRVSSGHGGKLGRRSVGASYWGPLREVKAKFPPYGTIKSFFLDAYAIRIYSHSVITWNARKRRTNIKNHGFDFVDAEEVFQGITYTYEDDRFSYGERRFVTLGLLRGNIVSLVHTEEEDHIHVISMRKATKREREIYFQSLAN